jgi:hypothetical protein
MAALCRTANPKGSRRRPAHKRIPMKFLSSFQRTPRAAESIVRSGVSKQTSISEADLFLRYGGARSDSPPALAPQRVGDLSRKRREKVDCNLLPFFYANTFTWSAGWRFYPASRRPQLRRRVGRGEPTGRILALCCLPARSCAFGNRD